MINQSLDKESIFEFRKQFNVDNMFVMTLDVDIENNNKTILNLAKENDFIHCLHWIRKEHISDDLSILDSNLGKGVVGVKFHGSYEKLSVDSQVYAPILKKLQKERAILLVHAGRYKDGAPESDTSYLHAIKVAKNYPDIKVVIAHMGGNDTSIVREAVNTATMVPNVWFDISGVSTPYRIEYAVEILGDERLLFGSDAPWCSLRAMYYNVEDALISQESKQKIFYENFVSILNN